MTTNRRFLRALAVALLLLLVPAVSTAELLSDVGSDSGQYDSSPLQLLGYGNNFGIVVNNIEDYNTLQFVYYRGVFYELPYDMINTPTKSVDAILKIDGVTVGNGTLSYNLLYEQDVAKHIQFWLDIDDFNPGDRTGKKFVTIQSDLTVLPNSFLIPTANGGYSEDTINIGFASATKQNEILKGTHMFRSGYEWKNEIITDDSYIYLTREIDDYTYYSEFTVGYDNNIVTDSSNNDVMIFHTGAGNWTVTNKYGRVFTGTFGEVDAPDDSQGQINLYVQNSQTGALISGAHILIEGTPTTSDWIEYVNETLSSGTAQYSLPGMPYQYRIVATADGYTYPAASQYFRAGETVIVNMEPALAAPVNESNTYLEFYTRDTSANPIPGVIVAVDDQWLYTNNNGYARFEVAKNATHPWIAKKSGYTTIEGTATTGPNPRYVVNVVLGPGTVPTYTPTPDPTTGETPGATPTPDRRTNEEKGQSIIDMIADNAEPLAALALLGTFLGLFKLMAKW